MVSHFINLLWRVPSSNVNDSFIAIINRQDKLYILYRLFLWLIICDLAAIHSLDLISMDGQCYIYFKNNVYISIPLSNYEDCIDLWKKH